MESKGITLRKTNATTEFYLNMDSLNKSFEDTSTTIHDELPINPLHTTVHTGPHTLMLIKSLHLRISLKHTSKSIELNTFNQLIKNILLRIQFAIGKEIFHSKCVTLLKEHNSQFPTSERNTEKSTINALENIDNLSNKLEFIISELDSVYSSLLSTDQMKVSF